MKEILLSVVIPCFDEMANLQKGVLDKIVHFLEKKKYSYEIIIVDDGSNDESVDFIEKFAKENSSITLIKNRHLGKAGAVTTGMLQAKGEYVLFTDMDQATPIEEVEKLLPYFSKEYDVVIGSRSDKRKGSPWTRLFISKSMIVLRKLLVGIPEIVDTQCGFKMFTREASQQLFQKMYELHHGFTNILGSAVTAGFDVELLYIAEKKGYKIKEVPVEWLYVETRRVNPVKDSLDGVIYLLNIRKNQLMGKYR
jgi:dolichyl-phosphate beta-glucosyltransferase